jgi:hypothetical protein
MSEPEKASDVLQDIIYDLLLRATENYRILLDMENGITPLSAGPWNKCEAFMPRKPVDGERT